MKRKIEQDLLGTLLVDDIVVTTLMSCSAPDDNDEFRVVLIYSDSNECKLQIEYVERLTQSANANGALRW